MERYTKLTGNVINFNVPVIMAEDQVIFVGTEIDPLDYVKVITSEEGNIPLVLGENIMVTHNVDPTTEGNYEVEYAVIDEDGVCAIKAIKVTVIEVPQLAINDVPELLIEEQIAFVGDPYDPLEEVNVTDRRGNPVYFEKIEVIRDEVDTQCAGTYEVEYQLTNQKGIVQTKTVQVMVIDLLATIAY